MPTPKGLPGAAAKPPEPSPSSTVTLSEPALAVTRSGFVSPFRSPIATEFGFEPTPKGLPGAAAKPPEPSPSSTVTLLEP